MSKKKASTTGTKSLTESQDLTAHSIWLAGLGALAVTVEGKAIEPFSHLVERGRDIEALGGVKLIEGMIKITRASAPRLAGKWVKTMKMPRVAPLSSAVHAAPSAAEVAHLLLNAEARKAFLAEFGTLTSGEVAALVGSSATNRAALANRWKAEGRIFAIETGGHTLFPAFQFSGDDGQPRPVIAEILAVLQPRLSGWQTALWFTGRNGWLGGKRPVDVLASNPSSVLEAARQETEAFD